MIVAMRSVPVYVTHELRVDGNLLGHDLVNDIFDDLTIPNDAHIKAKKREIWKWEEIPEFHEPFDLDGDIVVMPRGYALRLKKLLRVHRIKVDWIDRTKWAKGSPIGGDEFSYRDHQPAAVAAIKRHRQGFYKAPTGSGKTVTICGLIWDLSPRRTLILVDKKNLVTQWVKHINNHLNPDFPVGRISEGKWVEERITVATIQSIWSKRYDVGQDWFEQWDLVVLDECHHVAARMYYNLMSRFNARYLLGASATPDKTDEFELAKTVMGPVIYEDSHTELRESGVLIKPSVKVIYSDFQYPYYGDHNADKNGDCQKPGCRSKYPHHKHRNNYGDMLKALLQDESRNGLVMEILKRESDHTVLVATDQIKHIDAMLAEITYDGYMPLDDIYILTSKQKKAEERDEILNTVVKRGHGIIFSTIAHEGLDLPPVDRIVLPFPTRNGKKVEQQIGRGTRSTPGKTDCLVYDIADPVGPLMQQLRQRMLGCYQPLELDVEIVNKPAPKRKGLGRLSAT